MTENDIKQSWNNLFKPFIIGLLILIISQLIYHFGSRSIYMFGFYGSILGLTFMVYTSIQMFKFKKNLKRKPQVKIHD